MGAGFGRVDWSFEQNRVYTTAPQKQVEELGRSRGISVINMTDDFLERSKKEFPLYFAYDGHFLPAGHAVAAEAIFRELLPFLRQAEAPTKNADLPRNQREGPPGSKPRPIALDSLRGCSQSVMPGLTSRIRFSASEYMRHSRKQFGRGPTRFMLPARTLRSWGNFPI